jgi:hypothetical protein
MGWTTRVLGLDSRRELGIFLLTTASRTALEPTQTPSQWVTGALSLAVKRPRREADHSPPSRSEVKLRGTIPPLLQYASWRGTPLKKSTGTTLPLHLFYSVNLSSSICVSCASVDRELYFRGNAYLPGTTKLASYKCRAVTLSLSGGTSRQEPQVFMLKRYCLTPSEILNIKGEVQKVSLPLHCSFEIKTISYFNSNIS